MILVFGKTGQVARELQRFNAVVALGREDADLSNPESCKDAIIRYAPLAVINAAAFTAVDKAEGEEALAMVVNRDAPRAIAQTCVELSIPLVHISTDYVFEGTGEHLWQSTDATGPQNAYGRSKLAGELAIKQTGAVHAILRTSWVISAHASNFVKTMLRLSEVHDELTVVADQIGGPTPARDIAAACLKIAEQLKSAPSKSGTYHFSGSPNVSWAQFATEIFKQADRSIALTPILTRDYPTPAKRPLNSRLDCLELEKTFGILQPDWRNRLTEILRDLEVDA